MQTANANAAEAAAIEGPPVKPEKGWTKKHSWPYAQSAKAKQARQTATQVQAQNDQSIRQLQAQMNQLGC